MAKRKMTKGQIMICWVDTSAGGLLVHEGIIRPEASVSALT